MTITNPVATEKHEHAQARRSVARMTADIAARQGRAPTLHELDTIDSLLARADLAVASVQSRGYAITGIALNPTDLAKVPLADVVALGVPVVATPALTAGTTYAGDFSAQQAFSRPAEVHVSDSHGSDFISNIITVLAEVRALAVVSEPDALAKGSVSP